MLLEGGITVQKGRRYLEAISAGILADAHAKLSGALRLLLAQLKLELEHMADITYIRLKTEFVYLAVMLDAYSRKVVGWALERTLATRLPLAALEQAIAERQPPPG